MSTSIGGGGVSAKSLALTMHGQRILVHTKDLMEEDGQDPYFFDEDYSIAASTGWVVWEGSWAVIELLRDESSWLREMVHHRLLLELGSGTGLLGLCAAAAGAHAILSDVPSVVEGCTLPNVRANMAGGVAGTEVGGVVGTEVGEVVGTEVGAVGAAQAAQASPNGGAALTEPHTFKCAHGLVPFGGGSVGAQALDWNYGLSEQRQPRCVTAPVDLAKVDIILAAECAWLQVGDPNPNPNPTLPK